MPEHIRALVVILFLSTLVFFVAAPSSREITSRENFNHRRNVWFAVTLTAFLAHNFWIFTLITSAIIHISCKRESNNVALFFLILFAIPSNSLEIPGFGLVNYFFALSYQRMIVLVIFLPAFINLRGRKNTLSFGRSVTDKLLAGYLILVVFLYLRETTVTDTLRQAFYQITDVFLPYYVISRSVRDKQSIKEMFHCFVLAVFVMAPIALFESIRHWLLYDPLKDVLDIPSRFGGYQGRIGLTRASASVGPIPLGYLMVIGLGFYQYIQEQISSKLMRRLGLFFLMAGLVASLARAPWVAAILLFLIITITGNNYFRSFSKLILTLIIVVPLLSITLDVQKFYDILPYVGKTEEQRNVEYREKLLENSLIVMKRNPWFGSVNYRDTPEMEELRQGQNIIDIVNTYLQIGLETGFVGLSLFLGFFLTACWGVYRSFKAVQNRDPELHLMGRCLLASMISILFIIFTVSSVSIIPLTYWSVAALCVGYSNLVRGFLNSQNAISSELKKI